MKKNNCSAGDFGRFGIILVLFCLSALQAKITVVLNPYQGADWRRNSRKLTNLHTHTTESDGSQKPDAVIDEYKKKGYDILAITDHDRYTWPWTKWGRSPAELGMLGIPGCESSAHEHFNTFFFEYDGRHKILENTLDEVTYNGGLSQINHPGRYARSVSDYVVLLRKYSHITSIEVYNQGDRYDGDRELWDKLLTALMPDRPIWATSNDDSHNAGHIGRNFQMMLIPGRANMENFRSAYQTGRFYACYDRSGTGEYAEHPDSVIVYPNKITVFPKTLSKRIRWISNGKEVHRGATLNLMKSRGLKKYVRAVICGASGAMTLLQPFGLKDTEIEDKKLARLATYQMYLERISPEQYRLTTTMDISTRVTLLNLDGYVKSRGMLSPDNPFVIDHSSGKATLYILRFQTEDAVKSVIIMLK
jgi:hypothetical protein